MSGVLSGLVALAVVGEDVVRAEGGAGASPSRAIEVDRVLAVVDGRPVTWLEVQARIPPFDKRLAPAKKLELLRAAVTRRIDALLVAKAAVSQGLRVESDEVERAMTAVAASNHLTMAELLAAIRQQGYTMEGYRAEIRDQILEAKLVQRMLTPADVAGTEEERRARIERVRAETLQKLRAEAFVDVRL